MDLFTAIEKRHSYRGKFEDAKVPGEHLRKIVDAAIAAPSGCNAQTTSFIIVDDASLMASLGEITGNDTIRSAPGAIVVFSENVEVFAGAAFEKEDYAAAVENMLLAITALGYASVWIDGVLRSGGKAERVAELLGIPGRFTVDVILPVGIPVEIRRPAEKKSFEERAYLNRYEGA
jgi:nitroreductase